MLKLKYRKNLKEKEDNLKEPSLRNISKLYYKFLGFNPLKKLRT